MKLVTKYQQGGSASPFVDYLPFYAPRTVEAESKPTTKAKNTDDKDEGLNKDIKTLINQMVGKGLTSEVNNFASQIGELLNDAEILGQPLGARQYASITASLNAIQNNKVLFDEARKHVQSKGIGNEAALTADGGMYVQDIKTGEMMVVSPMQFNQNRENLRTVSNSELLRMRNTNPLFINNNALTNSVNDALSINDINADIQKIVSAIGTQENSTEYYVDKTKLQSVSNGIESIIKNGLNMAPGNDYKATITTKDAKDRETALYYIWNNLPIQSRNTLIARAAISGVGEDPQVQAIKNIANILNFGTDTSQTVKLTDNKEDSANGGSKGSKSSTKTAEARYMELLIGGPKEQKYTVSIADPKDKTKQYAFDVNATVAPLLDKNNDTVGFDYASNVLSKGGIMASVDINGASLGVGKSLNMSDMTKILYNGENIATAWLPYKINDKGAKEVDFELLNKIKAADEAVKKAGNITEQEKMQIYQEMGVLEYKYMDKLSPQDKLKYMHQFFIMPTYVPESIAEKNGLDTVLTKLEDDEFDAAANLYKQTIAKQPNKEARKAAYEPNDDSYWFDFIFDQDIYKSNLFIPVQDVQLGTLYVGESSAPTVPAEIRDRENVLAQQLPHISNQKTINTGNTLKLK